MKRTVSYLLLLSGVVLMSVAAFMWLPGRWLKAQQISAVPGIPQPYNIIFVVSDQEADHLLTTGKFELPARDVTQTARRRLPKPLHRICHVHAVASRLPEWSAAPGKWRFRPNGTWLRPES